MVSAWERALSRGEGSAAAAKKKYADFAPAARAPQRPVVAPAAPTPAPVSLDRQRGMSAPAASQPAVGPSVDDGLRQLALARQEEEERRRRERELEEAQRAQALARVAYSQQQRTGQTDVQRGLESFLPTYEGTMAQQGEIGALTPGYLRGEAVRSAELARDWFTPYQEFKAAEQALDEGRPGAAAGWGALGLLGLVPLGGDALQAAGWAARTAGSAGDVARGAEGAGSIFRGAPIEVSPKDVFYHGTASTLKKGESLLPPSVTGVRPNYAENMGDRSLVYVTKDPEEAYWWAIVSAVASGDPASAPKVYRISNLENASDSVRFPGQEVVASKGLVAENATELAGKNFFRTISDQKWEEVVSSRPDLADFFSRYFYRSSDLPVGANRAANRAADVGQAAETAQDATQTTLRVVDEVRSPVVETRVPYNLLAPTMGESIAKIPTYNINGETVAFGVDPILSGKLGRVREIPRNPFVALDIAPASSQGRSLAPDYIAAVNAVEAAGGTGTDVDALLYMARSGDSRAAEEFARLSRIGERPTVAPLRPQGDMSGIVLVHGTKYPARSFNGMVQLRPLGDFRSSTRGQQLMDYVNRYNANRSAEFPVYYPWRDTVHFSLNHRVNDVVGMGTQFSWSQRPYWVISNLEDVVAANPGSLSNLLRYDTWFTPEPGKGLLLPNSTVIEAPRPTGGAMSAQVGGTTRRMSQQEYLDAMINEELVRRGATPWTASGETMTSGRWGEVDSRISSLANTAGVPNSRHFETPYYYADTQPFDNLYNAGKGQGLPFFRDDYPISSNFLLRLLDSNRLSGSQFERAASKTKRTSDL